MMLYSKLVEGAGNAVYVCPDKYLLDQAKFYGSPICEIPEYKQFSADFLNYKGILQCNFHKLFNVKSISNRDNIEIGAIVRNTYVSFHPINSERNHKKIAKSICYSNITFA